jgi:hypothetical protein
MSEREAEDCEQQIAVDGTVFVTVKSSLDILSDFLEMLAEKEYAVKQLIANTRLHLMSGLDYDKLESLNE